MWCFNVAGLASFFKHFGYSLFYCRWLGVYVSNVLDMVFFTVAGLMCFKCFRYGVFTVAGLMSASNVLDMMFFTDASLVCFKHPGYDIVNVNGLMSVSNILHMMF